MSDTCRNYALKMSNTCLTHAHNMSDSIPNHTRDMPETSPTHAPKYSNHHQHIPNTSPKHPPRIPTTLLKHRDNTTNTSSSKCHNTPTHCNIIAQHIVNLSPRHLRNIATARKYCHDITRCGALFFSQSMLVAAIRCSHAAAFRRAREEPRPRTLCALPLGCWTKFRTPVGLAEPCDNTHRRRSGYALIIVRRRVHIYAFLCYVPHSFFML